MGDDDETELLRGFWLSQNGREQRHSDGSGGEAPMLSIMLHDLGWIDVGISETSAVVRLNPNAVDATIAAGLRGELEESAPGLRVELALYDPDIRPVSIAFQDAAGACAHLDRLLEARTRICSSESGDAESTAAYGSADAETETEKDDWAETMGYASVWGAEAYPMPTPFDLAAGVRYPSATPLRRDRDGSATGQIDEERFARDMAMAEWLAPLNTAGSLRDRRLIDSSPEMVSFALRSMGWVAIKRSWKLHGRSFRHTVPEAIAVDPTAVRPDALNQLIALCAEWALLPGEVTCAWWDGSVWRRERGGPAEVADRLKALCRVAVNDEPMSLVKSEEVSIHKVLASGAAWTDDHPFSVTLRRWRDKEARTEQGDAILRDLERLGLFQRRTKLLVIGDDEDMRIARYAPGQVRVWNERTHRAMEGSKLVDVPDRGLGLCVQRDLRTVQHRGEPVLHRCSGIVFGSDGMQMVRWSRLTVPIFVPGHGSARVGALLSTCDLEEAVSI
ncbi:hypothetical protein [Thalassobaculum sp.]|uniref:hypothetical protein n=1 Tax=Thalassobaculum sp. TaxID=2022740 RepID=UPI0032EF849B